jgi:hypothetical protein
MSLLVLQLFISGFRGNDDCFPASRASRNARSLGSPLPHCLGDLGLSEYAYGLGASLFFIATSYWCENSTGNTFAAANRCPASQAGTRVDLGASGTESRHGGRQGRFNESRYGGSLGHFNRSRHGG